MQKRASSIAIENLIVIALLVLLAVCSVNASRAKADTLASIPISNADFEVGGTTLQSWTFGNAEGGEGIWEWNTDAHSGKRSLRIDKSNASGYSMVVSDYIPVTAGKSYEVSAQTKVAGRSRANVYFMISQYNDQSPDMRLPNYFSEVQPLYTGDQWKPLAYKFLVRDGSTRIRIHAIMLGSPIDIRWDDFQLRETSAVDMEYKPRYEAPKLEVLPPLEPAIEHLKTRQRAVAVRRVVDGRVRFFIDGKMTDPVFYVSPFVNYNDGHIGDFEKAGVKLFLVPLVLGHGVYGDFGPWLGKNKYDWKEVDDRLWRILRVDPDANIIFYMATDPYLDWANEHPNAIVRDQNGEKVVVTMHPSDWGREPKHLAAGYQERWGHSYVSQDLRTDTEETLRQLIHHVQNSLPGKAVVGYHVAGGNDGQFFNWAGYKPGTTEPIAANYHLADYSPDSQHAFQIWLRQKYQTAANLQRAWNRPDVTFENATIPSGDRRLSSGFFFSAKTDEDIADYNRFYSEGNVETIQDYAHVIKQETRDQNLVSTYWEDSAAGVDSHFATGKMLQSPDIDFLSGPTDYGVRMPGQVGEAHSIWGSLMLHDRIWVSEQDYRSWLSGSVDPAYDRSVGRAETAQDHNNMVRRESGMMLAFGQGTWWYDMNGGWFADPGIMNGVAEARSAFTRDLSTTGQPRADVAVFVSERSLDYVKFEATWFRYNSITNQIRQLNLSGVPYQIFLQSDLNNSKLPDFKTYLFLNAQDIEPEQWTTIQKLKRAGKTLCFVHAPGIIKPENVGATSASEAISKVTGITVREAPEMEMMNISPTPPKGTTAASNLRNDKSTFPVLQEYLASNRIKGPVWQVTDPSAHAIGWYDEGGIGAARKGNIFFVGGSQLSAEFINALARYSVAWTAADAGDAVFANQHFITIHAMWDGDKTLHLLHPSEVTDLKSGQVISPLTQTIELSMQRGQTRWFFLQPK